MTQHKEVGDPHPCLVGLEVDARHDRCTTVLSMCSSKDHFDPSDGVRRRVDRSSDLTSAQCAPLDFSVKF